MTKAMPTIIMPELRLFAATIPAIGKAATMTAAIAFQLLILLPIWVIMAASSTIRAIFTNSVGWNWTGPTTSQRRFPFTTFPTRDVNIIST